MIFPHHTMMNLIIAMKSWNSHTLHLDIPLTAITPLPLIRRNQTNHLTNYCIHNINPSQLSFLRPLHYILDITPISNISNNPYIYTLNYNYPIYPHNTTYNIFISYHKRTLLQSFTSNKIKITLL
jgi:hypothetical protein